MAHGYWQPHGASYLPLARKRSRKDWQRIWWGRQHWPCEMETWFAAWARPMCLGSDGGARSLRQGSCCPADGQGRMSPQSNLDCRAAEESDPPGCGCL